MTGGGPRAVLVAVLAIGLAGIVVAVLTRTNEPPIRASSLGDVVAQVRAGFGDDRIAGAGEHGSTLSVVLTRPSSSSADLMRTQFEAQVLAGAVAEWMRSNGREPITAVDFRSRHGDRIGLGEGLVDAVPSTSGISSLRPGKCDSAAKASVRPPLTLASARTLPYLHGTCVFLFRTSEPLPGSTEAASVLGHMTGALGDVDKRPYYFELDDDHGKPQDAASWMPGVNGSTWARPGLSYAMAHG